MFLKQDQKIRKNIVIEIVSISLISNSILLILYSLNNIVQRNFYFNFERGSLLLVELILFLGLFVSLFSKGEIDLVINENIHDGLILTILLGLCCCTLTLNILIISLWLIFVLGFIGIIFYYSDYFKPLNILRYYIIGVIICIILLFLSCLIIFIQFNTLILTEIPITNNIFIYIFLLVGIGIPFGLIPFTTYHYKNIYHECSYTNLLLYFTLSIVSSFQVIRILNIFAFSSQINAFILLCISSIGLIISLISIIKELFGNFDGETYSIKKLFGYLICADFNFLIMLSSFIPILNTLGLEIDYYNMLFFYILLNSLIKLYLFYNFYPIMLETNDDNLHLLGDFWIKYKNFGLFYLISGFIVAIPFSFTILSSLSLILSNNSISENSLYFTTITILIVFFLIYIIIIITFISISFIFIFFGNKSEYIKREGIKGINRFYNIPNMVLLGLLILLILFFYYGNNFYYSWFSGFLLIIY
ncbi:MAG: hypothetical protein ACFFBP_08590 [Promethearchaeota archaeon]